MLRIWPPPLREDMMRRTHQRNRPRMHEKLPSATSTPAAPPHRTTNEVHPAGSAPTGDPGSCMEPQTYFRVVECVDRLFVRDRGVRPSDLDAVTDVALRRVEVGRATVLSPDCLDAWVSVVCRNAYLNFVRSRRPCRPLTDFDSVEDPRDGLAARYDRGIVRTALLDAIGRLPSFLREVARLRFAESWTHAMIAERTGKRMPIVRSYANKAANRLREDAHLMKVLRDWRG